MDLYSKWLDEDSTELELSQDELAQLKAQLQQVRHLRPGGKYFLPAPRFF